MATFSLKASGKSDEASFLLEGAERILLAVAHRWCAPHCICKALIHDACASFIGTVVSGGNSNLFTGQEKISWRRDIQAELLGPVYNLLHHVNVSCVQEFKSPVREQDVEQEERIQ
jgi:uncharacterized Ntn-hydrolase superfamily protein